MSWNREQIVGIDIVENIVDAQPLRNLSRRDGWKCKETFGGKIDDENVVVNLSKMVMKLWDGGDKDPCDNQIYLSFLNKSNKFEPEIQIKYQ